jgi:putative tricarboxylic transport membrane protein
VAPAIVGLILEPLAKQQLRRSLTPSEGAPSIPRVRPVTIVLWIIAVESLLIPVLLPLTRRCERR